MKLTCYQVDPQPAELVPGTPDREWMDRFFGSPSVSLLAAGGADTTGWALLSPVSFTATWTGGPRIEDIELDPDEDTPRAARSLGGVALLRRRAGVSHRLSFSHGPG
ncbi:MAG: hypothetical protein IPL62_14980 [Caulobacteraceae bacterium]|nr:hypothetical protein [Caulobacteraceae bacterium]